MSLADLWIVLIVDEKSIKSVYAIMITFGHKGE